MRYAYILTPPLLLPEQRREWQTLRYHLVRACLKSGIPPPEPSIPVPFPRQGLANPPPPAC